MRSNPQTPPGVVVGRSIVRGVPVAPGGDAFSPAWTPGAAVHAGPFVSASPSNVETACEAASEAFVLLGKVDRSARARMLDLAADGIAALGDTLVKAASDETGLPLPRIAGERDRTVRQLRMFAGIVREGSWVEAVIDSADPARQPLPKPDIRRMLRPLGPVAVFGASNFPLAYSVAGGDTASALAAGCSVIVKGHSAHPVTGELVARELAEAVAKAGLPSGTFGFLHAGGQRDSAVGAELVRHPAIAAGGFTGSVAGGMALARIASERPRPIPFFAEMGSVNPVVILPAAMKSKGSDIAAKIYGSFTNSAGQMCTCPGLILALSGADFEALAASLAALAKAGAAQPMLTPKVRDSWRSSIRDSIAAGAVPLAGPSNDSEPAERPVLLRVSSAGFRASPRLREECFGPSTLLVECTNVDDLAACVLSVGGSLTATLWAEESDPASQLLPALERIAGRVVLNGVPTGVEVCDAMVHSGPFPACNRPESTAVGAFAIRRWCRPVAYQALHDSLLPAELKSSNPLAIRRIVDGKWSC